MPTVEVLVGMIASGKSTYARERADRGAVVISHDDLTAMLHACYRYEQEKREFYRRCEESIAWNALAYGVDAVIDRTHLTRESRVRWIRWAKGYDSANTFDGHGPTTRVVAVVFQARSAPEHALRRAEGDHRGRSYSDWLSVARHHEEQAGKEPIDWRAEGFDGVRWVFR